MAILTAPWDLLTKILNQLKCFVQGKFKCISGASVTFLWSSASWPSERFVQSRAITMTLWIKTHNLYWTSTEHNISMYKQQDAGFTDLLYNKSCSIHLIHIYKACQLLGFGYSRCYLWLVSENHLQLEQQPKKQVEFEKVSNRLVLDLMCSLSENVNLPYTWHSVHAGQKMDSSTWEIKTVRQLWWSSAMSVLSALASNCPLAVWQRTWPGALTSDPGLFHSDAAPNLDKIE